MLINHWVQLHVYLYRLMLSINSIYYIEMETHENSFFNCALTSNHSPSTVINLHVVITLYLRR